MTKTHVDSMHTEAVPSPQEEWTTAQEDLVLSLALRQKYSKAQEELNVLYKSAEVKMSKLQKQLKEVENKFDHIENNIDHYEKWYIDLLTKSNATVEQTRKFLRKFTEEDINQLERIVNAIHGE